MIVDISMELLNLLRCKVKENIEEYLIDIVKKDGQEGFLGDILYVTLVHKKTQEQEMLVVKQEKVPAVHHQDELFKNEIYFYISIWPVLQNFYRNITGKEMDFIPNCFGTSTEGHKRIILENMKAKGFVMYDSTKPFDAEHCRAVSRTYGFYHAVSMALKKKQTKEYIRLTSPFVDVMKKFYSDGGMLAKKFEEGLQAAQEMFDPKTEANVIEKLRKYEKIGPKLVHQILDDTNFQGVLLHGDCWNNNYLFKYDVSRIDVSLNQTFSQLSTCNRIFINSISVAPSSNMFISFGLLISIWKKSCTH